MRPGDTFWIKGQGSHLAIVAAECKHDRILIIRVTSDEYAPRLCDIYQAEHPFLNRDSYLHAADANVGSRPQLLEFVRQGLIEIREPIGSEVLTRILKAVPNCTYCSAKVKRFITADCCPEP